MKNSFRRFACVEQVEPRRLMANVLPGFNDALVGGDLIQPVAMDIAPDGRVFVTEKRGDVRVIKDGQTLATPFTTLTVNSEGERGALGVTLDPNFSQNGFVYVYYTATTPTIHNRVSRFTANGDVAAAGSETVILDLDPLSDRTNHNGGHIAFGTDGKLYVSQGENGDATQSQSLATRFGKILRINADGSIPSDNPFFTTATGDNRSIWAMGLRNPFTFAFHPTTGQMFINDVGQSSFEEINVGIAGANYGWPEQEGTASTNPAFTAPKFFYARQGPDPIGTAITGGTFYAGTTQSFPAEYADDYFFADLGSRWIWKLDSVTGAATEFATDLGPAIDLQPGPDGSLYYDAYTLGEVRKISFSADAITPAAITSQPVSVQVNVGAPATFSVTATGDGLTYQWQRDGTDIAGATAATFTFQNANTTDSGAVFRAVVSGAIGTPVTSDGATLTVLPGASPTAVITTPVEGRQYRGGQTIKFKGTGTDTEDGRLLPPALSWSVELIHDGVSDSVMAETAGIRSGSFRVPRDFATTSADAFYRIHLTATDSDGQTSTVTRDVLPQTVQITVTPSQPGLQFTLDGTAMTAPVTFASIVGTRRILVAEATQVVDGVSYNFEKWTGRRKTELDLTVPSRDRSIQLQYVPQQNS